MRPALALILALSSWSSACGKSPAARARDVRVCADTADAGRIAACLRDRGWDAPSAESAATARAAQMDSDFRRQDDSVWHLDAPRHAADLARCTEQAGEVAECLQLAGWPLPRATASAESLWNAGAAEHLREIERCVERSARGNIADCLMLHFKWTARRALAANDSVQLARARR